MKILFVIKTLEYAGGAERVMTEIVNGLATRGNDVVVLSYDGTNSSSFYPLIKAVSWRRLGIGVTGRPATLLETVARMRELRREIAALKPDVAVGFMTSAYIPLSLALVGMGIPVIASEHTTRARYETRPLERFLLRFMPWFVQTITVVSQEIIDSYPPFLRRCMVVIQNPVRLSVSRHADVAGEQASRKVLLSVGRLIESKGYATLIDAFSQIADKVPDWDLRIIGDGNLRQTLQRQIASLGLRERVFLPGATQNISAEYESAQLFVLPSRFESLGLVVLEALAHGLPVVGFADCASVNRLVQPEYNGVLASGGARASALAEALLSLMINAEYRQLLVPPVFVLADDFIPERILDRWEVVVSLCSKNCKK